jgi:hypothetical protein
MALEPARPEAYSKRIDTNLETPVKNHPSFSTVLNEIADAFAQLMRLVAHTAKRVAALPWPALLAASIVLAFAITIIPLAFTLFVAFMLLKLAVAAIVVDKRRHEG